MKLLMLAALALFHAGGISFAVPAAIAADESDDGSAILNAYFTAAQKSQEDLRGYTMNVKMEGALPKLDRAGSMEAVRTVSSSGQVSYSGMVFQGNDTIKKDVIARYLQAEVEASKAPSIGITEANYKFKFYGMYGSGDWQQYLFELTPKRKATGLFKGWLWIDAKTKLPVREQGTFVKNPSVFLKKVEFVRDFDVRTGIAQPIEVTSTISTRIVGEAKLTIKYDDYKRNQTKALATLN